MERPDTKHLPKSIQKMANMKALLTTDRTLMSNYHNDEFQGFGTTVPPNVIPEWFFKLLFFPPTKTGMKPGINCSAGIRNA